jgi:glycosyltransferase involved in cell wall biosynthesis
VESIVADSDTYIAEEAVLTQPPLVSIVIPAYNERETVALVVERVYYTMWSLMYPFEIIVVDDGSLDGTFEAASILGTRVIRNQINMGKGLALRRGFEAAQGDIVVSIDADGSHNPEELDRFIYPLLSENDGIEAVIGSRFAESRFPEGLTFSHWFGNRLVNAFFFFLSGRYYSDTQCGYRAFRRDLLTNLRPVANGFGIESEMLMLMRRNVGVAEVPVKCPRRLGGKSSFNIVSDGMRILLSLFRAAH